MNTKRTAPHCIPGRFPACLWGLSLASGEAAAETLCPGTPRSLQRGRPASSTQGHVADVWEGATAVGHAAQDQPG